MTMTTLDFFEVIDFDAEVPCDLMVDETCSNPGDWVACFHCGPMSPPTCTAHMEWMKKQLTPVMDRHCICMHGHSHHMSELMWRRI